VWEESVDDYGRRLRRTMEGPASSPRFPLRSASYGGQAVDGPGRDQSSMAERERAGSVPESASIVFAMLFELFTNHLPMVSLLLSFPIPCRHFTPNSRICLDLSRVTVLYIRGTIPTLRRGEWEFMACVEGGMAAWLLAPTTTRSCGSVRSGSFPGAICTAGSRTRPVQPGRHSRAGRLRQRRQPQPGHEGPLRPHPPPDTQARAGAGEGVRG
jgi:hypothetical protein